MLVITDIMFLEQIAILYNITEIIGVLLIVYSKQ
jgi:hypothetical protein